jgi:ABC transport system ATP-binding/permease protein
MAIPPGPLLVTATDISVRYGVQIVLNNAALTIHQGERVGLIGSNGSGKTTLLKIIAGLMEPDSGSVTRRRELLTGYLSQDFQLDSSKNVYENIVDGAYDVIALLREYESLSPESEKRHTLEEQILHRDGWNLENRIETAMHSLNVPAKESRIETLSGGEKRRVALCKAIISRPDFLILDEPTNHLDTESIEWMEKFLEEYTGACLFVTHDRYFLDSIATRIIELANGECYSHDGNYDDFLLDKAERAAQLESEEQKRSNYMRRELAWVSRGARARRTKAKSRLKAYFEMLEQEEPKPEGDIELVIPPAAGLGATVLNFNGLGMELGGRNLFDGLDFHFDRKRKLGIIGRNGLGKTTLLKIILGDLRAANGEVEIGERTAFNYIDQSRVALNDDNTVVQELGEGREWIMFGEEKLKVWTYLRRFQFADDRMNTKVGKLSGGERSRLLLAKVLKNGGNFLILDEPTNDLDLPTLRVLEEALIAFTGCVIVVSHDRYFLNRVCNGILAFEGNGSVHFSEGDYDYYIEKKTARVAVEVKPEISQQKKTGVRTKPQVRKLTWKESKELETMEQTILAAEETIARLERLFSMPDFYAKHGNEIDTLTQELADSKTEVERLYLRWHELEEIKSGKEL